MVYGPFLILLALIYFVYYILCSINLINFAMSIVLYDRYYFRVLIASPMKGKC